MLGTSFDTTRLPSVSIRRYYVCSSNFACLAQSQPHSSCYILMQCASAVQISCKFIALVQMEQIE